MLLSVLALALSSLPALATQSKPKGTVDVQILAINDFHGNLQPPTGSSGRIGPSGTPEYGGAAFLATHLHNLEATNRRNTVIVSAGDMIGASPLLSALFHDEPTIEAANLWGVDFNAVGNHEFDEGIAELRRMARGRCHPVDGCQDGDRFKGADFQYLSANVVSERNGKTLFPAYKIRTIGGVKIAFIGLTLEGTPNIVTPSGVAGYDFLDEAETINKLIPKIRKQGAETVVVLIHEGGAQTPLPALDNIDGCTGFSGAISAIVENTNDEVDLWVSGHTHSPYNCVIDGDPVTSAYSFGRVVTDIDMKIDRRSGEPTQILIDNKEVTRDVTPDAAVTALIAKYDAIAAPLANRVIGSITANVVRAANAAGESALGDVIADGQLDATNDPGFGDAVVAFMNPGGIRADLTFAGSAAGEGDGNVTYGEMFTVQPFGNSLVTMTLTGAQIERLLEEQLAGCTLAAARILQVSAGFTYTWTASGGVCDKVNPATIMLNGVMIDPVTSYRVTVNSFLADGGDSFPILIQGTDRLGGSVDTDAFEAYFATNSPVPPGPQNRITVVP
ncbi:MAG TPA: bifunctional metallophosphatase/5'-nucleotidase [Acidimicrobiia bacterium]